MEHRYCLRKPLATRVQLYNGTRALAEGEAENISTGGLYVRLADTRAFPVDRVVEVAFDVPDRGGSCAIRSPAMVVHRNAHGIGLMFLNEDLTFSRILKRIVMELPEQPASRPVATGKVVAFRGRGARHGRSRVPQPEAEAEAGVD